jgi:hypothetical protein
MNESPEVVCSEHGSSARYSIICSHLVDARGLEYVALAECEHGPAQAWCARCNVIVEEERGWSDRAEAAAGLTLFCHACYRDTLQRHIFLHYVPGSDEPCDWSGLPDPTGKPLFSAGRGRKVGF